MAAECFLALMKWCSALPVLPLLSPRHRDGRYYNDDCLRPRGHELRRCAAAGVGGMQHSHQRFCFDLKENILFRALWLFSVLFSLNEQVMDAFNLPVKIFFPQDRHWSRCCCHYRPAIITVRCSSLKTIRGTNGIKIFYWTIRDQYLDWQWDLC